MIGGSSYGNDLGIRLDGERCYIGGMAIETNALDGIKIIDGQSNQIIGNYINSNGSDGISIEADAVTSDDNKIIGNEISFPVVLLRIVFPLIVFRLQRASIKIP